MIFQNIGKLVILILTLKSVSLLIYHHCLENYLQLVNHLEDASIVIKKEKAEESKKSE
jgi:hypothetical protein